jgi:8-oxo-dGTP pyrophosphatase MutT (NUDIX family)
MARVDYLDDPNAPVANSVVPSVTVAIRDDRGRILLIHKIDNDLWALPGGGHDAGERITDTAVREVKEETGLDIEVVRLVGTYTNPHHVMAYDDGEVRQQFSLCFEGRRIGGTPHEDGTETKAVRWVDRRRAGQPEHPPVDAPANRPRARPNPCGSLPRLSCGKTIRGALNRFLEDRRGLVPRPVHRVLWRVRLEYLGYALVIKSIARRWARSSGRL